MVVKQTVLLVDDRKTLNKEEIYREMFRSERGSELFCPKDFHAYSGAAVCSLFCRKKKCSVFKILKANSTGGSEQIVTLHNL